MESRSNMRQSRRSTAQLPDAVDADAQAQSPAAMGRPRRQSIAAAMQQMEYQEQGMARPGAFEMQPAGHEDSAVDSIKDLSRLKTMGVVQKLNKASFRSKIELQVITTFQPSKPV